MEDNFADVYPLGKKIEYMNGLLALRPRTLLPITSQEEAQLSASMPSETPLLLGHPVTQSHSLNSESLQNVQFNPYTHRFRRKLLLRQKKRNLQGSLEIFDLDLKVRQALLNLVPSDTKLARVHPRRSVQWFIGHETIISRNPINFDRKKGRRSKDMMKAIDIKRMERRKDVANERIAELPLTLSKLHHVHHRMEMMQTWISREDEIAINAINALNSAHKNENMEIDHQTQPPIENHETNNNITKINNGIVDQHAQIESDQSVQTSAANSNLGHSKPVERYSISSTFTSKVPSRQEVLLNQVKSIEERKRQISARGGKDTLSSSDMEKHLQMTINFVESFFDNSLDPYGKPWTFEEQLFGDIHDKRASAPIESPWSGRILKPIIRQDYESEPLKLSILLEIERRQHWAQPEWIAPPRPPIEYRYFRPYMTSQIKKLLVENFWPGIDVSESLLYPEFTIVAMFKELVIGCAFVTTFGYITYICVHPDWRRAGIAKFMLYHLIQSCAGKDVTLHVSCNNPAMLLYNQFCFKIEEKIKNFYDKYLPTNSLQSKDAFFMRLRR